MALGGAGLLAAGPVAAEGLADSLAAGPPTWEFGDWEARLSGFASGSAYTRDQPDGLGLRGSQDDTGVTGLSEVTLRVQRTFDSGLTMGARTQVLAYHDTLSGDRYGNDTFEKMYVYVSTAFGRLEAGQQDGAGAILGVTGPKVDDHVSLEDADTFFFRNPGNGRTASTRSSMPTPPHGRRQTMRKSISSRRGYWASNWDFH